MLKPSRYRGQVYVACDGAGWCKVGRSGKPSERAAIFTKARGRPVHIAYAGECRRDAWAVEQTAHWLLADHDHVGEWFRVSVDTACRAIEEAARKVGGGYLPDAQFTHTKLRRLPDELSDEAHKHLRQGETLRHFIEEAVRNEIAMRSSAVRERKDS